MGGGWGRVKRDHWASPPTLRPLSLFTNLLFQPREAEVCSLLSLDLGEFISTTSRNGARAGFKISPAWANPSSFWPSLSLRNETDAEQDWGWTMEATAMCQTLLFKQTGLHRGLTNKTTERKEFMLNYVDPQGWVLQSASEP